MILLLDNRDSFTFNLAHALEALGADFDECSAEEATQDGLFELAEEAGLIG